MVGSDQNSSAAGIAGDIDMGRFSEENFIAAEFHGSFGAFQDSVDGEEAAFGDEEDFSIGFDDIGRLDEAAGIDREGVG